MALSELETGVKQPRYQQKATVVEEILYEVRPRALPYLTRRCFLELGSTKASPEEVARFLVVFVVPRYGTTRGKGASTPDETAKMLADLRQLNLDLADKETWSGTIKVPRHRERVFEPQSRRAQPWTIVR